MFSLCKYRLSRKTRCVTNGTSLSWTVTKNAPDVSPTSNDAGILLRYVCLKRGRGLGVRGVLSSISNIMSGFWRGAAKTACYAPLKSGQFPAEVERAYLAARSPQEDGGAAVSAALPRHRRIPLYRTCAALRFLRPPREAVGAWC